MSISEVIKQATREGRSVQDAIAAYYAAEPIKLRDLQRQEKQNETKGAIGLRELKKQQKAQRTAQKKEQQEQPVPTETNHQRLPQRRSRTTYQAKGDEPLIGKPLQIRTTASQLTKIEAAVTESGLSQADWLRQAISCYLAVTPSIKMAVESSGLSWDKWIEQYGEEFYRGLTNNSNP